MPTQQDIEGLEKKYFEKIKTILINHKTALIKGFNSKDAIKRDYANLGYKENDVEKGAERVLQSLLSKQTNWDVNSAPISSDLLFETNDAMINIDAKTYKERHQEKNKINVGANQISYGQHVRMVSRPRKRGASSTRYTWKSALRTIYHHQILGEIPCLTFFVKFIYDDVTKLLKKIELISVPNGELENIYRNIFSRGKSKIKSGKPIRDIRVVINIFETPQLTSGWQRKEQIFP